MKNEKLTGILLGAAGALGFLGATIAIIVKLATYKYFFPGFSIYCLFVLLLCSVYFMLYGAFFLNKVFKKNKDEAVNEESLQKRFMTSDPKLLKKLAFIALIVAGVSFLHLWSTGLWILLFFPVVGVFVAFALIVFLGLRKKTN